jgi:hypothetical protein
MKHNVILVVLDGLNYEVAHHAMGHLQAYVGAGRAALYRWNASCRRCRDRSTNASSPACRRSTAASCTTTSTRLSNQRSIFHYARDAGLGTAAAAYHWVSELYNRSPFDAARDRHTDDKLPIQHGHFYWNDHYPDSHLFADAENLRLRHAPNFLLVHPMNIDDAGHKHGLDSSQYRNSARSGRHHPGRLPARLARSRLSGAGDRRPRHEQRPLAQRPAGRRARSAAVRLRRRLQPGPDAAPLQTELCGTVCELLGVPHDKPVCRELLK